MATYNGLVQPVGQKRLTNVAVVRLKKSGFRFEIACYKNKVLSWRSKVEKDIDEVLQSHTVYSNVSKGVLAKSKDLIKAFGTDDQTKICLEILEKGELQVAGKERESVLSSQFRDIATIIMEKTINPETNRPYTITMIERLMHEIHFAVDPNTSSKKQALDLIKELQKHFPIKRAPMRLRLIIPQSSFSSLLDKISSWEGTTIMSRDESGNEPSIVCEIEPSLYRECDALVRNMKGRLDILAVSAHTEGDAQVESSDDTEDYPSTSTRDAEPFNTDSISRLSDKMGKQQISIAGKSEEQGAKQKLCTSCNVSFGDAKQFREHSKTDWHKHNMVRKTKNLPPLTQEECLTEMQFENSNNDLKDYNF
ncbi:Ribosome maturation protein SBDS [Rhynchospora pubera]|uniref:Ribosome maturation protein SBDS n=1 Tax=Rhynchospora pubera TaxID=906938 RepID=A0AAV8G9F9_9POAL|nr:Ribosome maturation protein SBDS [Rhynchospora pubera]